MKQIIFVIVLLATSTFLSKSQTFNEFFVRSADIITDAELTVLGDHSFKNDRFAEAETYYRRALTKASDKAPDTLLYKLGETFLKQGKNVEAARFLQRSIGFSPQNAVLHYLLGSACFSLRQYTEAANSFKKACDLSENNPTYCDALTEVLDVDPEKAQANFNMGNQYAAEEDFVEAHPYFLKALQLDPQNRFYQDRVRRNELLALQQRHMNNATNAFVSAKVYEYSGHMDQAVELFKEAVIEVDRAKALGQLTQQMHERAAYYIFVYQDLFR